MCVSKGCLNLWCNWVMAACSVSLIVQMCANVSVCVCLERKCVSAKGASHLYFHKPCASPWSAAMEMSCVCLHAGVCVYGGATCLWTCWAVFASVPWSRKAAPPLLSRLCLCPVQPLEDALSPVLPSTWGETQIMISLSVKWWFIVNEQQFKEDVVYFQRSYDLCFCCKRLSLISLIALAREGQVRGQMKLLRWKQSHSETYCITCMTSLLECILLTVNM